MSRLMAKNIKLLVCDMTGTTVFENGIIYKTIKDVLNDYGFGVTERDMKEWYGKDKRDVLNTYTGLESGYIKNIEPVLIKKLEENYFDNDNVRLIHPELLYFFDELRKRDIKVALNTGYPESLQRRLIEHLGFEGRIDAYISSQSVFKGRPYPYMIHSLADTLMVKPSQIAKIGDTVPDMLEGRSAHCGLIIGTLTGVENDRTLRRYSDFNVLSIMDLNEF